MDTILYFYQKRNGSDVESEPEIAEYYLLDFRLVRLGLSKAAVMLLEQGLPYEEEHEKNIFMRIAGAIACRLFKRLYEGYCSRKSRVAAQQQKERLLKAVLQCWGDECTTSCVCGPHITYFDKWKFTGFMDMVWVERLLTKASLPNYVIIGRFAGLNELLLPRARRMRELTVYVTESDNNGDMEELAEELYEEYGLAAQVRVIEQNNYKNLAQTGTVPCNVLDFSGEGRMRTNIVAAGSRWLDFGSSDEKKRKIQNAGGDIIYFSLRDLFENPVKYEEDERFS